MPTYQYRCHHCGQVQSVFQNFHEVMAPACADCGGLTEKIIQQAPRVVKQDVQPEAAQPTEAPHDCGSACVLHRQISQPSPPAEQDA